MSIISGTSFVGTDAVGNQILYSNGGLPSGVANGLTWTSSLNGTYIASISVPGVDAGSLVQATISVNPAGGDFTDALASWLVSSYCGANAVNFVVAANPTQPSRFPIVWAITN